MDRMNLQTEYRTLATPVELRPSTRTNGTSATLVGYGAVFNQRTMIGGSFLEEVAPGAFTEAITRDSVRALFNHDPNWVLGRNSSGTMRLSEDAWGLRYEIDLALESPLAKHVHTAVRRGDVSGSSFSFLIDLDEITFTKDRTPIRRIKRVTLLDVGPVTYPAYAPTSVRLRSASTSLAAAQMSRERSRLRLAQVAG